jgi:hypothetical protein
MRELGTMPEMKMSVQDFDGFMRSERDRWGKLVRTLGIQPE